MANITNDQEMRRALESLSIDQQRHLGAQYANSVIDLIDNPRLKKFLEIAMDPAAVEEDREEAYKSAKSIAVKTYTACGRDADWILQAEHFIASACTAALTPDALIPEKQNLAWKAAIQARMAKNCIMIESETGEVENEATKQYQIAEDFIAA